jgi:hypothetical protein
MPFGFSFAEWAIKWWQWLLSIPKENNPAIDNNRTNCHVQQQGPVWFLAGVTTSSSAADKEVRLRHNITTLYHLALLKCYPDLLTDYKVSLIFQLNEPVDKDSSSLPLHRFSACFQTRRHYCHHQD